MNSQAKQQEQLMGNGCYIFQEIEDYISIFFHQESNPTTNEQTADKDEIEQTCKFFGQLFVLMDGIFSDFNVSRNEYHDSIIPRLEKS